MRIISSVVLTRLIAPEVYGMMDLAVVFLTGLHLFSDIGLGPAVIQSPRGNEPSFLQTAWTIQLLRGIVLGLGACVLAPIAAYVYDRPLLGYLLPVMGLMPMLDGLNSPGMMVMQRRIEQRWLVFLALLSSVVSLLVTVLGVYIAFPFETMEVFHGRLEAVPRTEGLVWAVAIAWIIGQAVSAGVSHLVAPTPPARLRWDSVAAREIVAPQQNLWVV